MAKLSYAARKKMPTKSFALPSKREGGKGGYPIPDIAHGRAALQAAGGARTGKPLPPAQKAQVKRKVYAKFPSLKKGGDVHCESPYEIVGGAIRTKVGVPMPSLDPRIPSPVPYANPAKSITEEGPRGDAKHVKI